MSNTTKTQTNTAPEPVRVTTAYDSGIYSGLRELATEDRRTFTAEVNVALASFIAMRQAEKGANA